MATNSAALFETIRSYGITAKTLNRMATWSEEKLFNLLEASRQAMPEIEAVRDGPFTFVANDSLSGRSVPLSTAEMRLAKAAQLARFAALYADTLLIRDPFEWYPHTHLIGTHTAIALEIEASDFADQSFRRRLMDDVRLVLFLEPLFAAGLAGFTKSAQHWCPSCVRASEESGQLDQLLEEPAEIAWQRRVAKMVRHIEHVFLRQGTTYVHQHGDHAHASIFVPEGLLEYDQMQRTLQLPPRLAKKAQEPIELSVRDARALRVFADEVDRIVDDISTQNATANRYNCHYITDRSIDFELMNIVRNRAAKSFNSAAVDALSHPLAFVDNVPLDHILKLRREEGEAFLVYRDAVRKVLSDAYGKTDKVLREAFDDEIRPELNKIDLTMKNARKQIAISTLIDVNIVLASVSIAAFSGLLPPEIGVPSELINVGAALGGWQGARGLASKIPGLRAVPKEVSDNKYAFLWKVRNQTQRA